MKNIVEFILESKKHIDTATLADFYQWYCAGEMPDGKADASIVDPEHCEGLYDCGWFDYFNNDDTEKSYKEIADFFKKNWDKQIKITSEDLGNTWEISFKLGPTTYYCDAINYFGGELD